MRVWAVGQTALLFCSVAAAVVSFVNPVLWGDQRWCNLQLGCVTSASRDGGLKTTHVGQGSSSSRSSKLVRCSRQRSVSNQETGFQTGRDFRAHCWCCCWNYRDWKSVKGDGIDIYWCRQTNQIFFDCFLWLVQNVYYVTANTIRMLFCENELNVKSCNIKIHLPSNKKFFPTHLITTARQTIATPQLRGSTHKDLPPHPPKIWHPFSVQITKNGGNKSTRQHVFCTSQLRVSATST